MVNNGNVNWGAFVMTYNRPEILVDTVRQLLEQTLPPKVILIIDNGENDLTEKAIKQIEFHSLEYKKMGYNAGPAGAARYGLTALAESGCEWILWGDDDDPPKFPDCVETLLTNANNRFDIVGAVGHSFSWQKGEIILTPDEVLDKSEWVNVDVIAGGMCLMIKRAVVEAGVLPDESIFYGFEELDFCLTAKQKGFSLAANTQLFKAYRANRKRSRVHVRGGRKKADALWREYYSVRNLLYIGKKFRRPAFVTRIVLRSYVKMFLNFRFGFSYGLKSARFTGQAIVDFFRGRMGQKEITR